MANSIKKIREQLQLTLDDLATYLGVHRSRVHHFEVGFGYESGENLIRIQALAALVKKNKAAKQENKWVKDEELQQKAKKWREEQKKKSKARAAELSYQLEEMKAKYNSAIKALDLLAAIAKDPDCNKEISTWIQTVAPKLAKTAMKNNPLVQAKMSVRIAELLGV